MTLYQLIIALTGCLFGLILFGRAAVDDKYHGTSHAAYVATPLVSIIIVLLIELYRRWQ